MQKVEPSHSHVFLGENHARNERKVWLVIALTTTMMVAEIAAGTIFGSMALLADGWHMATHAGAMLIALFAYVYARRHAGNRRFTFGTGKVGDLAGFASAVVLALVALLIGWESLMRIFTPVTIDFGQATAVAVIGLVVNLASAWLLKDDHHHHGHSHHGDHAHAHHDHHDHDHSHGDAHGSAQDHNLRAAYLHVLADALTSVLAIAALILGRYEGWVWLDPVMGVVGGLVIARWSYGLIRATSRVLLDTVPDEEDLEAEILEQLQEEEVTVSDLHVWQIGPGHCAAIVSLTAARPRETAYYRAKLAPIHELSHVTIEVHAA